MNRKEYIELGIEICHELVRNVPIKTISKSYEGRQNAAEIEKEWISKIRNFTHKGKEVKLLIKKEDDRFWVDFAFIYDGEFFPVNFKSGAGLTADNISGLKYIRYLIFWDMDREFNVCGMSEGGLAKSIILLLKKKIPFNNQNRDYFCLAHCTEDNSVKVVPVGCIHEEDLNTNPKNLFQANFHTCRIVERNLKQMVAFIITKFIEYQYKRAAPYLIFKNEGFSEKSIINL